MRGVAITLVVLFHVFGNGRVSGGIDAFLTISGFLITASLVRRAQRGRLQWGSYLARLARRLLPALLLVLSVVTVAGLLILPPSGHAQFWRELRASALYYQNWELVASQLGYTAAGPQSSPLQHIWSLSVQGQFYLVWFFVVLALAVTAQRLGRSVPLTVMVGLTLVGLASMVYYQVWASADQVAGYFDTGARIWQFALGGLVALLLPRVKLTRLARFVLGWCGLALLVSCGFILDGSALFPGPWALWPVLGVLMVIAAGQVGSWSSADRLLGIRPVRFVADVSYPWFLWHWPVLVLLLALTGQDRAGPLTAAGVVLGSLILAWLTQRVLDRRPGSLLIWWHDRRTTVVLLAAASLLATAGAGSSMALRSIEERQEQLQELAAGSDPNYPGAWVMDSRWAPPQDLVDVDPRPALEILRDDFPPLYDTLECVNSHHDVPDSIEPRWCEYGPSDAEHTVMMLGGSHTTHWFSPLTSIAERHGWRVLVSEKGGCQLLRGPQLPGDPEHTDTCYAYNDELLEQIAADPPDVIFTIGTTSALRTGEITPEGFVDVWHELDALGISVIAIRDTTRLNEDVADCLERLGWDASECGQPRAERLAGESPLVEVEDLPDNVLPIELTDYLCTDQWCPAIIGNVVVYRDHSHLSDVYARTLEPFLEEELLRVAPWLATE